MNKWKLYNFDLTEEQLQFCSMVFKCYIASTNNKIAARIAKQYLNKMEYKNLFIRKPEFIKTDK